MYQHMVPKAHFVIVDMEHDLVVTTKLFDSTTGQWPHTAVVIVHTSLSIKVANSPEIVR